MPASLLPAGSLYTETLETYRVEIILQRTDNVAGLVFYLSPDCKSRPLDPGDLEYPLTVSRPVKTPASCSPDFPTTTSPDYKSFA